MGKGICNRFYTAHMDGVFLMNANFLSDNADILNRIALKKEEE